MSKISRNVFCDLHHGDLYYSLHLLFEKRLKMKLFRPIGLEWFEKGFWKIAEPYGNAPDTIDQYLGVPRKVWSVQKEPTQRYGDIQLIDEIYYIPIKIGSGEYVQKAITFNKFLKMDFDFVAASYPGHELAYAELVQKYKTNAVYIMQIGNPHLQPRICRNVLLALNTSMPPGVNYIKYHPEHHKDYCYTPPTNHNTIKSFIADPRHEPNTKLFLKYEKGLPKFTFKIHGILGRDGVISGHLMPQAIKDSAFVWHVKHTGCGGFIDRPALACGRPCIIRSHYSYEHHTLIKDLFEDSVNCIDLDLGTMKENIEKIRYFSDPDRHREMCKNTAEKFNRDVNFDEEATLIKNWLNNLKLGLS